MKGTTPIVALTAYHAHTARMVDGLADADSGWRQSRHGHARAGNHSAGHVGHDDFAGARCHAWLNPVAGGGGYALRLL